MIDTHSGSPSRLSGRLAALALLAAGALLCALVLAAQAPAAKLGGKTVLAPEAATFETLAGAGVTVAPSGDAKAGGNGISFPITGGRVNVEDVKGKIKHSGGLTFSDHGTSLTVEDFVIKVGPKNVIRADVAGGGKVRLADLDLGAAKIRQRGGKVVISRVDVLLANKAAKALTATFGLPNLAGADLGDAKVKVKP